MTGIQRIAAERERQISGDGFNAANDQHYTDHELVKAALAYVAYYNTDLIMVENVWPWEAHWFKPSPIHPIRNLEKAGALIAAEIDRLQAAEEGRARA